MFDRIRNYFEQRLIKKVAQATITKLSAVSSYSKTTTFRIHHEAEATNALTFTGNDGEEIFSISAYGEAKWYKEDSYNEAAEMFLTHLSMHIEDKAGIIQNRREWENRITTAIVSEAADGPLSAEDLTNVIKKCIMYDKLKGIKN